MEPDQLHITPSFSWHLTQAYRRWRRSPALSVPVMLALALSTSAQGMALVSFILLVLRSVEAGLVGDVIAVLGGGDPLNIARRLVEGGVFNRIVEAALVSGGIYIAAQSLGSALTLAAEYGAYHRAATTGLTQVGEVLAFGFRLWPAMFRTYLLHETLVALPLAPSFAYLLIRLSRMGSGDPALQGAVYTFVQGFLIGLLASVIIRSLLVFTYPSVAVEGRPGLPALAMALRTTRRFPHYVLGYVVTRIVGYILVALLTIVSSFFGPTSATVVTIGALLIVDPLLHLTKTLLYMSAHGHGFMAEAGPESIAEDLSTGLPRHLWLRVRRGLRGLLEYMRDVRTIPYHALSILLFVGGGLVGWQMGPDVQPLLQALGIEPSSGRRMLVSISPSPLLGMDLFLHNWQVALQMALGGIGFGIPTSFFLITNGLVTGAVVSSMPPLGMTASFQLPGFIVLPASLLSGSMGLRLAHRVLRVLLVGRGGHEDLASDVAGTAHMLLGLAPLFFGAGIVETFLSPLL